MCPSAPLPRNFYPRSPRGERRDADRRHRLQGDDFYPRSPRGERPCICDLLWILRNFYPRSPRGERRFRAYDRQRIVPISIHAPREGSDAAVHPLRAEGPDFYPRSPRGERPGGPCRAGRSGDFYPRSPRGERLARLDQAGQPTEFLSTLPARGATTGGVDNSQQIKFLSTLPARGATGAGHPPQYRRADFYPRSPRGERHPHFGGQHPGNLISIHAPREGSDQSQFADTVSESISIHAPREGSDGIAMRTKSGL